MYDQVCNVVQDALTVFAKKNDVVLSVIGKVHPASSDLTSMLLQDHDGTLRAEIIITLPSSSPSPLK